MRRFDRRQSLKGAGKLVLSVSHSRTRPIVPGVVYSPRSDARLCRIGQEHFAATGAVLRDRPFEQGGRHMRIRAPIAALAALVVAVTAAATAAARPASQPSGETSAAPTDV